MCGIGGVLSLTGEPVPGLRRRLELLNALQRHRGPDGEGIWIHPHGHVGFSHRRLSVIDLVGGAQPMTDGAGLWVTYNGEIYNYREIRDELGADRFVTSSDTEVILRAWRRWGPECLQRFRGMFAFALWDETDGTLFCARDRFGIKPFCYAEIGGHLVFASEAKALLPFLAAIETDVEGLKDYLAFQFCLEGKTLFRGVRELLPAHALHVRGGNVSIRRYWEVFYDIDFGRTSEDCEERLRELLLDSVHLHLRADVPLGAYVSGGTDSSVVASLAAEERPDGFEGFTGRFAAGPEYDESRYARLLAERRGFPLREVEIGARDFVRELPDVIARLDYPVAGPGAFPQYVVSRLAASRRKVVLGGQGGDEIFGGYVRYLVAYFEQCLKAAIDGTSRNGHFIVTYESIIPNLTALRNYKPLLQEFWREGLFDDMDRRYFRLISRAPATHAAIRWEMLGDYSPFETFRRIFHGTNVAKESYFDLMTHFDFKTLLPALFHVEDRVSMAHGLESRVPLLDHPLVEYAATIPSNVKFRDGEAKHVFKRAMARFVPSEILARTDKMGFPVPLTEWARGEAREFVRDVFSSSASASRPWVDNRRFLERMEREPKFSRTLWGLLSLELWQTQYHDRAPEFLALGRQCEVSP